MEKFLEKSLSSIKNQTYQNYELIFLDNCSDDKSKEIFEKYKDQNLNISKQIKNLSYMRQEI